MAVRFRKVRLFLLLTFAALMISLHSCVTFRMSSKEVGKFFTDKKVKATQHQYKVGFREIHYVKAGDDSKPLVLFVHGSPGSLSAFIDFLTDTALLPKATLITTDRPGFGYSNFGNGERSLQKQAEALKPILEEYKKNKPVILIGHSLGGPLIARMAMDYPELVDGLVEISDGQ